MGVKASIANKRWNSGKKIETNWYADDSINIDAKSSVEHTMLSKGATINSATITNCSLLENVTIGLNSKLDETLVGRDTTIGEHCVLNNVVIDHGSIVPDNTVLSDAEWPIVA